MQFAHTVEPRRPHRRAKYLCASVLAIAAIFAASEAEALTCPPGQVLVTTPVGTQFCSPESGGGSTSSSSSGEAGPISGDVYGWGIARNLIIGINGSGYQGGEDPFGDVTSIRDRGAVATSVNGAFNGTSVSSHTIDAGGGADGSYIASKFFNLAANQQLVLYGQFRYDAYSTSYDASAFAPGFGNTGFTHNDTYTFMGAFRYYIGSAYFGAGAAGNFGHGNMSNNIDGGFGTFNDHGYATGFVIGNVFTLYGAPAAQSSYSPDGKSSPLPTKAPPRQSSPGYALQLDLSGHVVYANDQIGSFTDSSGFAWGTQTAHFGVAGASAKLFATIPSGRVVWTPYVGANFDQQFSHSDILNIPAQALATADAISYGKAQTFAGAELGLSAHDISGFIVGIRGYYTGSSEYQIAGGQAFVRYQFPR